MNTPEELASPALESFLSLSQVHTQELGDGLMDPHAVRKLFSNIEAQWGEIGLVIGDLSLVQIVNSFLPHILAYVQGAGDTQVDLIYNRRLAEQIDAHLDTNV